MIEGLPAQFMNWRLTSDGVKVPCLRDGTVVDAHNRANWSTYSAAVLAPFDVAFVITENDPYFFLDLDKCLQPDGNWSPAATAIFMSFSGAMGEVSTSGTGLHILGKCNKAQLQDRRNKWDGWLEFYTQGRFIAFGKAGWQPIGGTADPERDWTPELLRLVPQRAELGELLVGRAPEYTGPEDDDELIAKMLSQKGSAGAMFGLRATIKQLWEADPELAKIFPAYSGDGFDHSSADAALMAHLAFWTGKDMPRMDRLFRRSALMRDKWEKREDYRLKTTGDAARLCSKVYDVAPKEKKAVSLPPPEVYLTIDEEIEHFKGCVYIRDQHRIMVPDGSLLKPEQFNATYGGHVFAMQPDGTSPTKKAFEAFTENRAHRFPKVKKSVFDPEQPPGAVMNDTVNTYFPADVDVVEGDISRFLDFMTKLFPDPRDREIITCYCAAVIQYPGVKFQWAPVLQGAEGNGKTFLANCVAYAIGELHTHRPNAKQLAEKFNAYIEHSLFIIVEEVDMQGRREMLDTLKPLVTNEWIEIRGMQQEKRMVKNRGNWFFCTNHQDAVMKSRNDRRYCMFFCPQQSYDDIIRDGMGGNYFPDLYNWAKSGGYSHVAHYLKNYQINPEFNPAKGCHRAPTTSTTHIAIEKSTGAVEREIIEATEDGTKGFRGGWVSTHALEKLLKDKHFRISRNKRTEILEELGYVKCPTLPGGRVSRPIPEEDFKRPMLYVNGVELQDDVLLQYCRAQGYTSAMAPPQIENGPTKGK